MIGLGSDKNRDPWGVAALVPVSNDKIQITLLILGRCALSNLVDWASGNGRTKTRAPLAWRSSIYLSPHFHHSIFIYQSSGKDEGKWKTSGKLGKEESAVHCLCSLEEFVPDLFFYLNLKQPGDEVDLCSENIALPSPPPLSFTHT